MLFPKIARPHKTVESLVKAQVQLELDMRSVGIERFNKSQQRAIDSGAESETAGSHKIITETVDTLAKVIQSYLDYYTGRCGKPSSSLGFLQLLEPRQAALVTLRSVFDTFSKTDVFIGAIAERVGRKIEDEVRFSGLEKIAPQYIEAIKESLAKNNSSSYSHKRRVLSSTEDKLVAQKQMNSWKKWNKQDCIQLGSLLIDMFAEYVTFNGNQLIVKETVWVENSLKPLKETRLALTEDAIEWLAEFNEKVEEMAPAYSPCVILPRDWRYSQVQKDQEGGYHVSEIASTLSMIRGRKSQRERNTEDQCPNVYACLNNLQSVPTAISLQVLAVAQHVAENRLPLAMPSFSPLNAGEAPIPSAIKHLEGKELYEAMTVAEQKRFMVWKEEARDTATLELQRKADLMKISRILAECRKYADFHNLYHVYSLDFRDRVYAQGSLYTPQGEDLQKGLIRFSRGAKLGENGYKWLAFQGANVYGNDKVEIDERVSFIEDKTTEIMAIASDPISNRQWVNADKPWQYLNWCFEWAELQQWIEEGNEIETFVSFIPVAKDGSCSGIQHYSAILRDPVGAASVNLMPSPMPQDIYGEVARILTEELANMAEASEEGSAFARQWLSIKDGITRTLCKPPVMTTPYGSTQISCRKTVKEYLVTLQVKENRKALAEEREPAQIHGFKDNLHEALSFLVPKLWKCIGKVVKAARIAMAFIKEIASKLGKSGKHMEWTTPNGFIVEQKIYETKARKVYTQMFGGTVIQIQEHTNKIDARKMGTSAAPNFVHSLDASHLISTVVACFEAGIKDMLVIHDSFACHAGNVDTMGRILLEEFVNMYENNDVLQDLLDDNEEAHLMDLDMETPDTFGFDLDEILESEYAFS